jgi:uncharacterized damage-inducible protein DinB
MRRPNLVFWVRFATAGFQSATKSSRVIAGTHDDVGMIKKTYAFLLILLFAASLPAQMAEARSAWVSISNNLISAAAKFPEADYGFRPTAQTRTFGQLIGHVADAHYMFCAPMLPQGKTRSGVEKLSVKAEILTALKESVNFCTAAADRVGDSDAERVKFFNKELPKLTLLWMNIAHSNEHYGNAVTYMRLKGIVPPSSDSSALRTRVYYDHAHGEFGPPAGMAELGSRVGYSLASLEQTISPDSLKNVRLLYLRAPSKEFSRAEKDAIVGYLKQGGSLLLVVDEDQRQPLAVTGVNDVIEPFGMKLSGDTPYLHNCGALGKSGEILKADREIPYSGGRAVEGGTPFAFQLDKDGKPAQPAAAWTKVENGGRIVVMAEGMASLFLGNAAGQRLSGPPRDAQNTVYWGKDSAIFMEEVLAWLVAR